MTSSISEKIDHTVLLIYLLAVSIKRPGLNFLKKSINRPVLSFFLNSRSQEQPGLIKESLYVVVISGHNL